MDVQARESGTSAVIGTLTDDQVLVVDRYWSSYPSGRGDRHRRFISAPGRDCGTTFPSALAGQAGPLRYSIRCADSEFWKLRWLIDSVRIVECLADPVRAPLSVYQDDHLRSLALRVR